MQFLKIFLSLSVALGFVSSCGNNGGVQGALSRQSMRNQANVDDLALLLNDHPEVSAASLRDIKISSQKKKATDGDVSLALPDASVSEALSTGLNPEVAKKAQDLVDKILDEFAFEEQVSAGIKMMGIAINQVKEMMKNMEGHMKEMENTKGFSGPSKFDGGLGDKEISCEEIVNNPYLKIPKGEIERVNKINKKLIKETLSGCPALTAGKFLQCTKDFNIFTAMINEHATCSMQNFEELEKSIDAAMDGKFAELNESVTGCMTEEFAKCNFKPEQPNNTEIAASNEQVKSEANSIKVPQSPQVPKAPEFPKVPEVSPPLGHSDFDKPVIVPEPVIDFEPHV